MHVEYAQLPPPGNSADRIFITENAVIVLDGATAFAPVPVSAQAYADHLGRAIVLHLSTGTDLDLRVVVANAIVETARALDLAPETSPSSTVSIVRANPSALDVLVLGDSPVLWGNEDETWALTDDRMKQLRLPESDQYRTRLRAGHGFDEEHRACLRALQLAQNQHRNTDGGYWIADVDPLAAYHAVVAAVPAADFRWAILATDGAFNLLEYQGPPEYPSIALYNSDKLNRLLALLHDWEEIHDPNGQHFPRSKLHDDKTIAALTFNTTLPG